MKFTPKNGPKNEAGEIEPVHMPWDASLKALNSGAYDVVGNPASLRGPDQPGAQSPAPGTDPFDGSKEKAFDGQVLTNMTPVATSGGKVADGLPKEPTASQLSPSKATAPVSAPAAKPAG